MVHHANASQTGACLSMADILTVLYAGVLHYRAGEPQWFDRDRFVLDFAAFCGARKFLLASSGAVYGKQPSDLAHISEDYYGAP